MQDTLESQQDWRYERKFLLEQNDYALLEQSILNNRMYFRKLHAERQINNIYFDTTDYSCFAQNLDGLPGRRKLRVRWYGNTFGRIEKPVLELKIKQGLLGRKARYRLRSFELSRPFNRRLIMDSLAASELPETISDAVATMFPTLLNSYHRRYFISADGRYRLTLDYRLTYYTIDHGSNVALSRRDSDHVIIEIKYDADDDTNIDFISNDFPFRMTKSSKYVQGIGATFPSL
jgi:SPX domain protein involved in polyphosphate accumulation